MNQDIRQKIEAFFDGSTKAYDRGHILTLAGQEPTGVSLLLDGVVEQYDITPEGNKVTVNIFKPPAFFPMSWAINRTPNEYFYAALTDVKLKRVDADAAVEFLRDNPDVTFDLLSRVYRGADALLRRLTLAARGIASSRLIFELLIEAYRFGTETGDAKRVVQITQSSLAARSGLARETVSRELHKLEGERLLALTKHGIVLDIAQLEKRLHVAV